VRPGVGRDHQEYLAGRGRAAVDARQHLQCVGVGQFRLGQIHRDEQEIAFQRVAKPGMELPFCAGSDLSADVHDQAAAMPMRGE
jgi:hypothetical protein